MNKYRYYLISESELYNFVIAKKHMEVIDAKINHAFDGNGKKWNEFYNMLFDGANIEERVDKYMAAKNYMTSDFILGDKVIE